MEKSLRDLKLTNDELNKLGKAFKDPTFCKLFADYAKELNDPENKRRYEEEIKMAEMERGVDVEFINPTPFCVLKTRNWPSLSAEVKEHNRAPEKTPIGTDEQKVFINICSSDKLERPEFVSCEGGQPPTWRIPHSFSPPVEDLDKANKLCLVVDVVFHPEAIKRSKEFKALRRLLHVTAVEGVHGQFGYFLGFTKEQARAAWVSSRSEKAILASVRLLKGLTHKGLIRATVIRRRRADFVRCQERLVEAEKAAFSEARNSSNAKESLAALSKYKKIMEEHLGTAVNTPEKEFGISSKYKKPNVTITHSSEFDMLDYTNDCCQITRSTRPTAIKVEIDLPGVESAACLDLDITEKQLHMQCEKPVAYQLKTDLPYPVESEKGKAKFDKTTHKLLLMLPVIPSPKTNSSMNELNDYSETGSTNNKTGPLIEVISPTATEVNEGSGTVHAIDNDDVLGFGKKRRRKKHKKSTDSSESTINSSESDCPVNPVEKSFNGFSTSTLEIKNLIKIDRLPSTRLVVPKTSSLASIRVRQDVTLFTVVVEVRNVLPETLQLAWSAGRAALRLMLTCASRGASGCTLRWGIVLHCPAPTPSHRDEQLDHDLCESEGNDDSDVEPRVVCCDVSSNNVAIVLRKPSSMCFWWESIAVGRALGPGLQQVPILGATPDLANFLQCPLKGQDQKTSLRITMHSPDCVQFSVGESPQSRRTSPIVIKNSLSPPPSAPVVNTCGSIESDSGFPLRGILKQRSTSECSLDGCGQTHFGSSLGAFPRPLLCSDEFPSNSGDETNLAFTMSHKHEITSATTQESSTRPVTFFRRRVTSVNFSKRDENVAFSPLDPVQTLHNSLRNKAKNARRSERRKRHSFTDSSITLNEMKTANEHEACRTEVAPLTSKQKRNQQRRYKQEEYMRHHVQVHLNADQDPVEAIAGDNKLSTTILETENRHEKPASVAVNPTKSSSVDAGGCRLWNLGEFSKRDCPNSRASVCPVTLTANAIFELDAE